MTRNRLQVQAIPALRDNYIWMLHDGRSAAVVDPGVAEPVLRVLDEQRLELCAVLLTHLHYDHNLGVPELLQRGSVPVIGPLLNHHDRISHPPFPKPGTVPLDCVTRVVGEGDKVRIDQLGAELSVLAVPGHTKGHIVFMDEDRYWAFTGDTLFGGGCGKVFGGSMRAMIDSLERLAGLPEQTQIYCAHEYTLSNLQFALAVEPANAALAARYEADSRKRQMGLPTLPSTIGVERATNPFLRVMQSQVLESLRIQRGIHAVDRVESFEALRAWKNEFKG
jgi:hydroxyacylglutathione hydrolase